MTDEKSETTASDRIDSYRRAILQTVAAGSMAGVAGLGGAQETTTEGDGEATTPDGETTTQDRGERAGFFERGTEVGIQTVANGDLTAPTDFAIAEGVEDRQFVADQTGQVYVIDSDGLRSRPFIDVSDQLVELGTFYGLYADQSQSYDERGLLGIEFHPDFQNNRKFYLHYSAPPNATLRQIHWDHIEIVSEFRATGNARRGLPNTERRLLEIPKPQYNHNGGPIAFGPDGFLYIPMGDGGGANDDMYGHAPDWYEANRGGNGQDVVSNLLGNVLRIDVDSTTEDKPYGIPEDNPFVGDNPGLDEIYAYGFRNPFGISFDSQGRMFVADAGQNLYEEANIVENGGNYGWNVKEGTHCFSTDNPSQPGPECPDSEPNESPYDGSQFIDPIVEYPHTYNGEYVGIVIVGGYVYEQNTVPGLQGKYLFGDWTKDPTRQQPQGRLLAATPPESGTVTTNGETTAVGETTNGETTAVGETTTGEQAATGEQTTTDGQTATGEQTTTDSQTTTGGQTTGNPDVPRDQLWQMEELVVAGSPDGTLDWFVRQFGRGADGEIYVLVSKRGVPEGDTGAVLKIVPPGEGDGTGARTQTTSEATTGGATTVEDEEETTTGTETTTAAQDR